MALASILALLMGAYCIMAGIVRVGTLAELFSRPMRVGYLSGLAIVVVVSQLPKLFGFSTTANGLRAEFSAFVQGISDGKTVPASLLIGLASLVAILALRFWLPKVPGVFLAVVGATVLVERVRPLGSWRRRPGGDSRGHSEAIDPSGWASRCGHTGPGRVGHGLRYARRHIGPVT